MSFRVVSVEPSSPSGIAISSTIEKLEEALAFALVLSREGLDVVRIEDAAGAMVRNADEVKAWAAARPRKRNEP